ncbi:MAG: beta-class carbonic anhydrase [Candidatus Helarchaeota archaeon]
MITNEIQNEISQLFLKYEHSRYNFEDLKLIYERLSGIPELNKFFFYDLFKMALDLFISGQQAQAMKMILQIVSIAHVPEEEKKLLKQEIITTFCGVEQMHEKELTDFEDLIKEQHFYFEDEEKPLELMEKRENEIVSEMLQRANNYQMISFSRETEGILGPSPIKKIAFVTCMDCRVDLERIFNLKPGEAIIIRNAGNITNLGTLRSLLLAVYELNVEIIFIIGHSDCGAKATEKDLTNLLEKMAKKLNLKTEEVLSLLYIDNLKEFKYMLNPIQDEKSNVKKGVKYLRDKGIFPDNIIIKGFLYDVKTGRLEEVR